MSKELSIDTLKLLFDDIKKTRVWPTFYSMRINDCYRIMDELRSKKVNVNADVMEQEIILYFESNKYHSSGIFDDGYDYIDYVNDPKYML